MTESELKILSIAELLLLADKAMNLYVAASVDAKNKSLADQRQSDLFIPYRVITEKRANETPLK